MEVSDGVYAWQTISWNGK